MNVSCYNQISWYRYWFNFSCGILRWFYHPEVKWPILWKSWLVCKNTNFYGLFLTYAVYGYSFISRLYRSNEIVTPSVTSWCRISRSLYAHISEDECWCYVVSLNEKSINEWPQLLIVILTCSLAKGEECFAFFPL